MTRNLTPEWGNIAVYISANNHASQRTRLSVVSTIGHKTGKSGQQVHRASGLLTIWAVLLRSWNTAYAKTREAAAVESTTGGMHKKELRQVFTFLNKKKLTCSNESSVSQQCQSPTLLSSWKLVIACHCFIFTWIRILMCVITTSQYLSVHTTRRLFLKKAYKKGDGRHTDTDSHIPSTLPAVCDMIIIKAHTIKIYSSFCGESKRGNI